MPLPALLADTLELPVVGSPLFIVSGPDLVIAHDAPPVAELVERLKAEFTDAGVEFFKRARA